MAGLLGTLLRMEGHEVTTLDQTHDLPEAILRLKPDVILLDMLFAHHNGLELVARVRKAETDRHVYIVMMSGLSAEAECLSSGADHFLLKPFMPDELTGLLRSHLNGSP